MSYKVPLKDIRFVQNEVLNMPAHYQRFTRGQAAETELVDAILDEAAKFCENELAPLNAIGDEQGCTFKDGVVTTPDGFKAAYDQYIEGGWTGLSAPEQYGGQNLPESIGLIVNEMSVTANHAWNMYAGLSGGAMKTLNTHARDDLKQRYLPKMVEGKWSGTMCLTEPHCGSDLGLLKTSAVVDESSDEEGAYLISGSKIFISAGEHDLTENIVHIVLARLPDAPKGIGGISLFVVPKFNVNSDGSLGERNGVSCGSIEEKMGIHGNATCVMNFDSAKGYLISKPHKGMSAMFTFINESRLGVAMQGSSHAEASFQKSLAYAKDRIQMRSPKIKEREKAADPIIVHPDVRRMLLTQKAIAEGGRMLNMYCGQLVDIAHNDEFDEKEREQAESLLAILTPIGKGFLTEMGLESTTHGVQVLGGHGFIKEWGLEQEYRDARIATIYEGTTGIQGLDLLGRKILGTRGAIMKPLMKEMDAFLKEHKKNKFVKQLAGYVKTWESLTRSIGFSAMTDADEVNGAAVEYLMLAGYITVGYFWAKAAIIAEQALDNGVSEPEFYKTKISVCEFYYDHLLPRTLGLEASIKNGVKSMMSIEEDHFAFL